VQSQFCGQIYHNRGTHRDLVDTVQVAVLEREAPTSKRSVGRGVCHLSVTADCFEMTAVNDKKIFFKKNKNKIRCILQKSFMCA